MAYTRTFQKGETVPIYAEVKDWDGHLVTPTSIVITVNNPAGTASVTDAAMTEVSTGLYVYYMATLSTDSSGWWTTSIKVTDGSGGSAKVTIVKGGYKLE